MRILKTQRSRGGRSRRSKNLVNKRTSCGEKFSEKLQALKSLLPPPSTTTEHSRQEADVEEDAVSGETEQLFQETADYIVRLRTQVVVLQKLIEMYGSSDQTIDNFVL